ncbi:Cytidine and deoxycytidylate deaminase zinc-binding region [Phytophthora infestans]|uniref:dCMP deaminase n=1 Tax=Phytophthora infestans TaxID=4787 RepID=A0A833THJ4_PHYIN|nr:Cytidine and deoxycytidylate deaminase zinc-binding region [Phytophthora infestans]KAF4130965.1 Cytidine and deoxycytidylate deaminase zinc-binding region [Phytophthora infestans]KAF4144939.1 Cytidine and deoxycytidylate deaminase zinc-binding region [Phytophthora infestans]
MAGKLSGRQVMELFYTEVERPPPTDGMKEEVDVTTLFRCKCGKTRAQRLKHGYTNLVQHVLVKHPDWVAAATREAHPIPVPALANGGKSSTPPNNKANGKARTPAESDEEVANGTALDGNDVSWDASEDENKLETQKAVTTLPLAVQKRSDYLSWDDYFMSVAFLSAMRSKDPSTQVGACIVNPERKIVGIGYNGFPNGCGDDELPWARETATNSPLDTKYPYVCHAEMNAILNKNSTDVKGCSIYVALFPCNECAKLIIQSGIARVVYYSDKYKSDWKFVASRRLLDMAGVQYTQHKLQLSKVVIDFTSVM